MSRNIGYKQTATTDAANGMWDLRQQLRNKRDSSWPYPIVFFDDFETFTGWTTVGTGVVSQSSTQAYSGTYSAYKTTNGDPNGAYKLLDRSINREFVLTAWIWRESDTGGTLDRLALVDSSGNGYGLATFASSTLQIERRDAYSGNSINTYSPSWTRPVNTAWYKVEFIGNSDNTFTFNIYDDSGAFQDGFTSSADATYSGPFDRVAILGGYPFYVDDLRVTAP